MQLASDLVAGQLVTQGRTLPFDWSLTKAVGDETALADAAMAATFAGATLGIGLVCTGDTDSRGLIAGQLHLAIAGNGGEPTPLPALPLRATLPEVQRRSSLHAMDMLRRHLSAVR